LKVDKVVGKQLSTNDYTVAEKDKLTAIQAGAQVNILEGVQRNGTNLTIIDKKVNVIVPTTPSEVGAEPANINIQGHISSTSNPHLVTKAQVGLGSTDDTSDANKPVSVAQKAALDLKQTVFTGICQEQFLTENDIVIDNTAMTLTIVTVKNGQAISSLNPICFYTDGNGTAVKHEKSTPVVFNFTNTDGVWYFYFDSSGNPIATQTSWSDFSTMASVYRFYWNSTLTVSDRRVIESIEYHKNDISWSDHVWKHSEGTKYLSGFNISHNATVSATPNANGSNAVVTLSSGSNIDDNMEYSVTHSATGSVKFTQNLGTGLLPATSGKFICISNDASLKLQKIPATDFPFLWNPSTNIPQYLTPTGVRTDVGNGYFFVYYIYALQDPRYGEAIKIKSAETDFASSTLAAAHNWEQLQAIFPTLRDGEIRLLYKLTFEYKSAYDIGTKKAALRVVDDLRKQKTTTTATAGGLLPATSVVVSPIGNIASTNVQSALQELDSEKQPVGTYSTDIHSNITALNDVLGSNHGDETLTSIKTKLGAATSVSDGYLKYQDFADFSAKVSNATHTGDATGSTALTLATVNSNVGTYNNVTINAKGLATAGSNVSYLTSFTETDPTIYAWAKAANKPSYTYSEVGAEPAFSKNTGFNLPIGTTAGTVLEGRTFGTASGSAVGDFIQNNNSSAQPANQYIAGTSNVGGFRVSGDVLITNGVGLEMYYNASNKISFINSYDRGVTNSNHPLYFNASEFNFSGSATFSSTINSTGYLLNGNNLFSSLTTNSIPKWNGSTFVNSGIIYDGFWGLINTVGTGSDYDWAVLHKDNAAIIRIAKDSKNVEIPAVTPSTLPTNGALAVGGGIGADHVRANNFYGALTGNASTATNVAYSGLIGTVPTWNQNTIGSAATLTTSRTIWGQSFNGSGNVSGAISGATTGDFSGTVTASSFSGSGSSLTGVQLPITITTNGTSGAATKVGDVINIPNYSSNSVDQALTTVNGSTSGNIVGSMPFQTANYKKVIVYVNFVSGNATYTFPTQFNTEWNLHTNTLGASYSSVSVIGTSVTITGATNAAGVLIIEGY